MEIQDTLYNEPKPLNYVEAVKAGAVAAVLFIVLQTMLYVVDVNMFVNGNMKLIALVIAYGLLIYMGIQYRKNFHEDFLEYGKAFIFLLVAATVWNTIDSVFQGVLYNYVNADLANMEKEVAIKGVAKGMKFLGEDALEKAINEIEKTDFTRTPAFLLKNLGQATLISAVMSLIFALIIRKKRPETFD